MEGGVEGKGMCQNHSATKKAKAAGHSSRSVRAGSRAAAISGAATSASTICCATRAAKSDTDNAQSGETSASAATAQPPTASGLRPVGARSTATSMSAASTAISSGSRFHRSAKVPTAGGAPQ